MAVDVDPDGLDRPRPGARRRRHPRGRVTEIFGPESSGKTTLVQHIIAEAQRTGGVAALIDAEHALDPDYAQQAAACNVDELLISQPDTGEQALEICEALVRSGAVDVVAIDSVAALVPRAELEGDMGDTHVGLQARLMSQALRKLTGAISRSKTSVIFTNQLREKIGVMFGNPETTAGGRALKFYSSVRLDIRRIESIKQGTEVIGSRAKVRVVKNKVAPPFRQAEFDIMYSEGISKEGDLLDVGVELGIVQEGGAFHLLRRHPPGPGPRERARVPAPEPRDGGRDRAPDPPADGRGAQPGARAGARGAGAPTGCPSLVEQPALVAVDGMTGKGGLRQQTPCA